MKMFKTILKLLFVVILCNFQNPNGFFLPSGFKFGGKTIKMTPLNTNQDQQNKGVSSSDRRLIVDLHNKFRSQVQPTASNMQKMYWDEKIAEIAQRYAEACPGDHDTAKDRNVEGYNVFIGQNLGFGYSSWKLTIEKGWHGELKKYNYKYGVDPDSYLGQGGWKKVGHYTQVVTDRAVRIGCGYQLCGGLFRTYVCNYAQGNNQDMGRPYKSGQSCAQCRDHCRDQLCDCNGMLCHNKGSLDLRTCSCKCKTPFKGEKCEQKGGIKTSRGRQGGYGRRHGFKGRGGARPEGANEKSRNRHNFQGGYTGGHRSNDPDGSRPGGNQRSRGRHNFRGSYRHSNRFIGQVIGSASSGARPGGSERPIGRHNFQGRSRGGHRFNGARLGIFKVEV